MSARRLAILSSVSLIAVVALNAPPSHAAQEAANPCAATTCANAGQYLCTTVLDTLPGGPTVEYQCYQRTPKPPGE